MRSSGEAEAFALAHAGTGRQHDEGLVSLGGSAARSASMAAVSRGTISLGCFLGSFVFSHGEALTRRSRLAAL